MSASEPLTVLLVDDHELIRQGLARAFERAEDFSSWARPARSRRASPSPSSSSPTSSSPTSGCPTAPGSTSSATCARSERDVGHRGADHVRRGRAALRRPRGRGLRLRGQGLPHRRRGRRRPPRQRLASLVRRRRPGRRDAPPDDAVSGPSSRPGRPRCSACSPRGWASRRSPASSSSSESTAKTHISKIYEKLGAANRAQAIMNAIRAGLLSATNRCDRRRNRRQKWSSRGQQVLAISGHGPGGHPMGAVLSRFSGCADRPC